MSSPEPPHRDHERPPTEGHRTPRWVRVTVVALVVLVALLVILMLAGGEHGPGRHVDLGVHAATA
jgi:hypothetical protein